MASNPRPFSCVTWNLHRCCGNDGVVDVDRTLDVLEGEVWQPGYDALILTEADADGPPYAGLLDIDRVEAMTGLRTIHRAPAHRWSDRSGGFLGTIMFVHPSFTLDDVHIIDLPGRVHRGAVIAELSRDGVSFRLIGAHLSLMQVLRWAQIRVLSQYIERQPPMPNVLAGDLNEWRPWGGWAFSHRRFGVNFEGPARATFPVGRPVLPLDRVLATHPASVIMTQVLDGPGIKMASDHRPLVAKVDLGAPHQTPPSRARVQR